MIQNLAAAGVGREPSSLGIHLKLVDAYTGNKVADVLKAVETKYPYVGTSLIPVFFPGTMRVPEEEQEFWTNAEQLRKAKNEHGVMKKERGGKERNWITQQDELP